jgi:hypothetical protein
MQHVKIEISEYLRRELKTARWIIIAVGALTGSLWVWAQLPLWFGA